MELPHETASILFNSQYRKATDPLYIRDYGGRRRIRARYLPYGMRDRAASESGNESATSEPESGNESAKGAIAAIPAPARPSWTPARKWPVSGHSPVQEWLVSGHLRSPSGERAADLDGWPSTAYPFSKQDHHHRQRLDEGHGSRSQPCPCPPHQSSVPSLEPGPHGLHGEGVVPFRGGEHSLGLRCRGREWLLDEDRFAGCGDDFESRRVRMDWRTDVDAINVGRCHEIFQGAERRPDAMLVGEGSRATEVARCDGNDLRRG